MHLLSIKDLGPCDIRGYRESSGMQVVSGEQEQSQSHERLSLS